LHSLRAAGFCKLTALIWGESPYMQGSRPLGRYPQFSGRVVMTTFDKRKDAFENKYAYDEELRFKAEARRNKLLGLWVAELTGKSGDAAEAYARSVIEADFAEKGDEDVFRKVRDDLAGAGVERSEHQIRRTMDELMAKAIEQVRSEKK
jgi:hypothetical protein